MGPTGEGETCNPRSPRWWVLVLLALVIGIIVGVVLTHAGEQTRVAGRVDLNDTMSRRTGYGRVDGVGKVERLGLDGPGGSTQAEPAARGESTSPRGDQT